MLDGPGSARRSAVGAVITAFQPGAPLVEACRSLVDQVDLVVVVDDGSDAAAARVLDACEQLGVVLVRHGRNRGIGAALNSGVSVVAEHFLHRPHHVLTLDQDSAVPAGYVQALLAAAGAAAAAGVTVGMVGPDGAGRVRLGAPTTEGDVLHGREPIQSGLLIPSTTFEAVGMFDADLFIDGVDSDFYLRATQAGRPAIVARGTELDHQLGREHVVSLLGRHVGLVHAAGFRYYYIARNRIALLRRHGRHHPRWAARAVLKDARHLALTTMLVPGRIERLRNTVAGVRDGLRGVSGPRPAP